ncbi:swiprosin [Anopheles darlingi]|uniref:Swiprosin n=1 Tax=Anopheles darlingi TaxID=43151 RepID=W5J250_ANODA|nr:swiprosin [Anopheles darlingi]
MSADAELSSILNRRQQINEALDNGESVKPTFKVVNVYTEFHEFTRKEIKDYQATFSNIVVAGTRHHPDVYTNYGSPRLCDGYELITSGRPPNDQRMGSNDGYLDLAELKIMMEKLGAPQTHLGLKGMIAEVDEDVDGKISFREFLLIYRKARAGELISDSGLGQLARLTEIDVDEVGVGGAKNFFEAKIEQQLRTNKFHDEIRQEQEERRRMEEERIVRRQQFQQRAAVFQ